MNPQTKTSPPGLQPLVETTIFGKQFSKHNLNPFHFHRQGMAGAMIEIAGDDGFFLKSTLLWNLLRPK
jgi:hypothetical protein